MNGHAITKQSLSFEEKMGLLEDRTASDIDSEAGSVDIDARYKIPSWIPLITAPFVYLRSVHWHTLVIRFFVFLIPSFLQGRHAREQIRPVKLAPTAYLDGMRGLAALFVFFCHYSYQAFTIAEGWGCGETNYHILKLPFLRLWYQGPAAVCVFFVISGYALTYRPLKLVRARAMADFASTMGSLVFRRWARLFIPPIISTFVIYCLIRIGAYDLTREFASDRTYLKNIMEPHPQRWESAQLQFIDWFWNMFRFVHVWDWLPHGGSTGRFTTYASRYRC